MEVAYVMLLPLVGQALNIPRLFLVAGLLSCQPVLGRPLLAPATTSRSPALPLPSYEGNGALGPRAAASFFRSIEGIRNRVNEAYAQN